MSRMKVPQAASTAAMTCEGLWPSSSAIPFFRFLLKYSANDSLLLISCSVFLPPGIKETERLGLRW